LTLYYLIKAGVKCLNGNTIVMTNVIEREKNVTDNSRVIKIANISLDTDLRQVYIYGRSIRLTVMEFDLLSYLVVNRNRAISRKELLGEVWQFENLVETRATDDMIKRLRKKLKHAGSQMEITTVWGYGFKIEVPENANSKKAE
jgi:two-component system OmpR family response regulator